VYVGHFNHGVRGAAADQDESWLTELCQRLGVPLEVGRADGSAQVVDQGNGWEDMARNTRYQFLRDVAERLGARHVAVAHTADDQAETVLHRIVRGTGLAGLAGISSARPLSESVTLIRPLLAVRRSEVLRYLAAIGQDYRSDKTNADLRFTRNRLRHELLPTIRKRYNQEVDEALLRLAAQAGEAQQVISGLADNLAEMCVRMDATTPRFIRIDSRPLADQPPLLVREVFKVAWIQAKWPLQAMGFHEWTMLASLALAAEPLPRLNLPGDVFASRRDSEVVIERRDEPLAATASSRGSPRSY
jgi:tRNA(Ile)-lysidine synthase